MWIGVYPQFFIDRMEPSIDEVMRSVAGAYGRMADADRPFIADYSTASSRPTAGRESQPVAARSLGNE